MGSLVNVPIQIAIAPQTGIAVANSVFGPATATNLEAAAHTLSQVSPVAGAFSFF